MRHTKAKQESEKNFLQNLVCYGRLTNGRTQKVVNDRAVRMATVKKTTASENAATSSIGHRVKPTHECDRISLR